MKTNKKRHIARRIILFILLLLVAAIVINVVALFLVTAGYSILSHMEIDQPSDMEIRFSNS